MSEAEWNRAQANNHLDRHKRRRESLEHKLREWRCEGQLSLPLEEVGDGGEEEEGGGTRR
jgi:hypothetical protein